MKFRIDKIAGPLKTSFLIFCVIIIIIANAQMYYKQIIKQNLTSYLDSIHSTLSLYHELEKNNIHSNKTAKNMAIAKINDIRIKNNYCIWIDNEHNITLINTLLKNDAHQNHNILANFEKKFQKSIRLSIFFKPWQWSLCASLINPFPFNLLYLLCLLLLPGLFFILLYLKRSNTDGTEQHIVQELLSNKILLFSGKEKTDLQIKNFYKNVLETIITGVWVTNESNIIFYINKAFEEVTGIKPDYLIGKKFYEDFNMEGTRFFKPYYNIARQTLKASHFDCLPVKLPSNRKLFLSGWFIPRIHKQKFNGMICTIQNVTERKIAEEELERIHNDLEKIVADRTTELKQSNIQLQQEIVEKQSAQVELRKEKETVQKYLDIAEVMLIALSKDQTIQLINKKGCRILDYPEEELLGKNWLENFIPEQERHKFTVFFNDLLKGIVDPQEYYENYITIRSGEERLIAWHNTLLKNERGFITGLLCSGEDITEQRKQEEALLASEKKYRQLFETSSDGIVFVKLDGTYENANKAFTDMIGYSIDELKKMSYKDITPKKWLKFQEEVVVSQIKMFGYCEEYEKEYLRKDGSIFPVVIHSWLVKDENGKPLRTMAIIRDITLQKRIESEKEKVKRLESLGILAGGIAHDFNNLLSGILGNISIALINNNIPSNIKTILKSAEAASIRARDLSRQLLTFSKGGDPIKKIIDISDIIKETCLFHLKNSDIKCDFNINESLSPVEADQGQISQVIQNLIINAKQSMDNKGTIHVSASNTVLDFNNPYNLPPTDYVLISVKDEGEGISDENIKKIFDPYFTTKEKGPAKGSGLGLATCFSIIKKHDGHIFAESKLGEGSCFNILIPASNESSPELPHNTETPVTGEGNILIMDDEKMVRDVLGNMLICLGYNVEYSKTGEEAIKKYKQANKSTNPFDCVILDLTVSKGMGGKEAITKLLNFDPEIKAIVTSGYSNDQTIANFKEFGFCGAIIKPIQITELSNTMINVLGQKNESAI